VSIEVHESGTDPTALCHGTANLVRIHAKEKTSQSDRRERKKVWGKAQWDAKTSVWGDNKTKTYCNKVTTWGRNADDGNKRIGYW